MPITAEANGKRFTFPDGTTQAQMGEAIDDFFQNQPQQPVEDSTSFGQQALGVVENAAALTSGAIAEPVAGLVGLAQTLNPFAEEGAGASAVESVSDALTYQPSTDAGKSQQRAIGETLAPVGEALTGAEKFLGDNTLELTDSPALAAIAHSLPTAALELLGVKGARKVTAVKTPTQKMIEKTLIEAAPDVDKVKNASRAIFKELDESGVAIKQPALKRLEANLDRVARKQGIRQRVTPEAWGAIEEVKKDIAVGNSLSTSQMDELRTIAKNSIVATDPNKARVGGLIVDEVDDFLDGIKAVDIERGAQVNARDVGKKYKAARKLWGRAKRSEMIKEAIEMGASRKAGIEKGIRNELNNLLNRKKSRKFLSDDDVMAIRKVTDGDFKQNFASLVGGLGLKLENSPSLFGSVIGGGGIGALASTIPGLGGVAAPAVVGAITVGTISKEVAKRITKNRAKFLQATTAAGSDANGIVKAYMNAVPKGKRKISDLSDLLVDPNVDLDTLTSIGNETVADAVKAAQFKREALQAVTALGAGQLNNGVNDNER